MTRRKKREFNKERHEQDMNKEAFKFPLDIDGTDSSDDGAIQPLDTPPAYVRRPQRETKYKTHKPSVKRPTRMTISKARQVPSAVYGLNKPKRSDRNERDIYLEKLKNDNSVIVQKVVEERMQ